jgi:hypothetical protein
VPSYKSHLNSYGTPPVADADHTIVDPIRCGEARLDASVTAAVVEGAIANGMVLANSGELLVLPELRAPTRIV